MPKTSTTAVLNRQAFLSLVEDRDFKDVDFGDNTVRLVRMSAANRMRLGIRGQMINEAADKVALSFESVAEMVSACVVDENLEPIFRNVGEAISWLERTSSGDVDQLLVAIIDYNGLGEEAVEEAVENFTTRRNGALHTA